MFRHRRMLSNRATLDVLQTRGLRLRRAPALGSTTGTPKLTYHATPTPLAGVATVRSPWLARAYQASEADERIARGHRLTSSTPRQPSTLTLACSAKRRRSGSRQQFVPIYNEELRVFRPWLRPVRSQVRALVSGSPEALFQGHHSRGHMALSCLALQCAKSQTMWSKPGLPPHCRGIWVAANPSALKRKAPLGTGLSLQVGGFQLKQLQSYDLSTKFAVTALQRETKKKAAVEVERAGVGALHPRSGSLPRPVVSGS